MHQLKKKQKQTEKSFKFLDWTDPIQYMDCMGKGVAANW
jgi:hypothetical protein